MASVGSRVKRRDWLVGCATGAASLALGWARRAGACGSSAEYNEEEVIELASVTNEPPRELAHFFVQGSDAIAEHRFAVSPDGDYLCFADRHSGEFLVESA